MDARHRALTPSLAASYLEAASVCLSLHHASPTQFALEENQSESVVSVVWAEPDERTKAAWANRDDATRDGAYALAIAALEMCRGLYAIRRAETRTGADYYIAPKSFASDDLEDWSRLEVSGTHLDRSEVKRRLRMKLFQAKRGRSNLPAIAAIVGFGVRLVLIESVHEA